MECQSRQNVGKKYCCTRSQSMLDKIRVGINKASQEIMDRDGYVSAEKVRNAFLGMGQTHKTLLAVFRQNNEDYDKQVGKRKANAVIGNIVPYITIWKSSSSIATR